MAEKSFDPYHKWLGIPPRYQPPDHYRLLGLISFEDDLDVVQSAADQRMAHLKTFQAGPHGAASQKILNELAVARRCLLDRASKAAYDEGLRRQLAVDQAPVVPRTSPPQVPVARSLPLPTVPASTVPASNVPSVPRFEVATSTRASVRPRRNERGAALAVVTCILLAIVAGLVYLNSRGTRPGNDTPMANGQPGQGPGSNNALVQGNADRDVGQPAEKVAQPGEKGGEATGIQDERDQPNLPASSPREISQEDPDQSSADPAKNLDDVQDSMATETPTDEATEEGVEAATDEETPAESDEDQEATGKGETKIDEPAETEEAPPKSKPTPAKKARTPKRPRFVPKGSIFNDGHWYWFSATRATAEAAQRHANSLKGRLLSIDSEEENSFVTPHVIGPTFLGMLKVDGVWINAAQRRQEYFNWDSGQPSSGAKERFAAIHANGVWHDYLPDSLYYCIEWNMEK